MNFLDHYIFLILIFSPLAASFFITLIPTTDTGSKLTVSRFFAVAGFLAFARIFLIFLDHQIPAQSALSFSVHNFNISLTLILTKYNVFLYGAAAISLLVNSFLYEVRDTKTNIHQVAPFLLIFFLYVSFGQTDLRVALPILSIANFLVYFLIGFTNKIRRGSTIFQMGIFLFACDALALVLLQIPYSDKTPSLSTTIIDVLLLAPGMARLCLPMLAPFMKLLLLNIDDKEGPHLVVFLQLSGLLVLIMAKADFTNLPDVLTIILGCTAIIGAIYVSLLAILDYKTETIPYYFLLFYSSLSVIALFISNDDDLWFFSVSLFLTNIACFFQTVRVANFINKYRKQESYLPRLQSTWFLTLALSVGLPGFGIGTPLWVLIYRFLSLSPFYQDLPLATFWILFSLAWLIGLVLLACAAIFSVQKELLPPIPFYQRTFDGHIPIKRSLLLGPFITAVISWLIPMIVFYAKSQGI